MRTALTSFSRDFARAIRPLLEPFDEAIRAIDDVPDDELRAEVLAELNDSRVQFGELLEKVESQQTYVMIFGPLKSGKSTLMNALAGAYVSEVTSLPAYPAIVFVSDSDEPSFCVTRYDGSSEALENPDALHELIDEAHVELAEAIRAAERDGRDFDPARDFPRTLKRIDVKIPAGDLASSDLVMVDTPGLYTRMKFGYDAMTRDFRHAASIAIFVVRSDNIFLEQVFEEFTELLDLFSRVFLVLNFDSSKLDVNAEGRLVPSVEQTDPERIVQAFENFSMNARLKDAQEEGRLRIVPIDLLHAASTRLQAARNNDEIVASADAADESPDRFIEFRDELSAFIDSNDYLNTFVGDSLTRSSIILDQLEGATSRSAIRHFLTRLEALVAARDTERRLLQAVRDLTEFDWTAALAREHQSGAQRVRERAQVIADALHSQIDRALDAWFACDASLDEFVETDLIPKFDRARDELRDVVLDELRRRIDSGLGGFALPEELTDAIGLIDFDVSAVGRECLAEVEGRPVNRPRSRAPLSSEDVPVKKGFFDWILFRSRETVRDRLLGTPASPTQSVLAARKARVLGDPARQSMVAAIEHSRDEQIRSMLARLERDVNGVFRAAFEERTREALAYRSDVLEPKVNDLVREVELRRGVPLRLEALRTALREARTELQVVRDRNTPSLEEIEIVPYSVTTGDVEQPTLETEAAADAADDFSEASAVPVSTDPIPNA